MASVLTPVERRPLADPVSFTATDATRSRRFDFSGIDGHRLVSELSASIATEMDLPGNTPYAVRDHARAQMLLDDVPVGSQIPDAGTDLVLVPKSHLG